MTFVRAEKSRERKRLMAIRDGISHERRTVAAQRICEVLQADPAYVGCDSLIAYAAMRSELDLSAVLTDALSDGKAVYLPRTAGREMEFYRIRSPEELVPGDFGVRVPAGEEAFDSASVVHPLLLLPGVAYDRDGNRMGYGGGYYDRYLEAHPELIPHTIAVGYEEQLTEHLPVDAHDIKPARLLLV